MLTPNKVAWQNLIAVVSVQKLTDIIHFGLLTTNCSTHTWKLHIRFFIFCRMRRAPKQQILQMLLSSEKIFQEEGRGWIWISKHVFFPEISLWKVGPLMIYWNDHKSLPCNCRWINLFSSSRTIFVCAVVWLNSNLSKLMIREMHLRSIFICIAM